MSYRFVIKLLCNFEAIAERHVPDYYALIKFRRHFDDEDSSRLRFSETSKPKKIQCETLAVGVNELDDKRQPQQRSTGDFFMFLSVTRGS